MNDTSLTPQNGDSPFDGIRRTRPDGSDFWSGRDLMPLLGYDRWENFSQAIDRAKIAVNAQGGSVAEVFRDATNNPGDQGGRPQRDVELTRFAAYQVAMCGDPRKPEVAAALAYFAIRTREAETAKPAFQIPQTMSEALRLAADQFDRAEVEKVRADTAETTNRVLSKRIEKDAPLIAKAEAHSASTTWIHRQDFAREVKQWGQGRGVPIKHEHVYELLRRKKLLIAGERSDRNQATSHAIDAGWARNSKGTADNGHEYVTTRISPRGQDIAWKWITTHVDEFGTLTPQAVTA